jgi:hypothetical protein
MPNDRTSRAAETRDKTSRKKSWAPPSMLDAPEAPPGYKYRWIREAAGGTDDKVNMSKRMREGYEPVRAEDHPDFMAPTVDEGKHAGTIGVGGLILAKIPQEIADERNAYYRNQAEQAVDAADHDLMRESHASMPISKPNRKSQTTFGNPLNRNDSEDS